MGIAIINSSHLNEINTGVFLCLVFFENQKLVRRTFITYYLPIHTLFFPFSYLWYSIPNPLVLAQITIFQIIHHPLIFDLFPSITYLFRHIHLLFTYIIFLIIHAKITSLYSTKV